MDMYVILYYFLIIMNTISKQECSNIYKEYKVDCETITANKYIRFLNRKYNNIKENEKTEFISVITEAIEKAKKCRDLRIQHSRDCWHDIDYGHIAEIARAKHFIKLYELRLRQLNRTDKNAIQRLEETIQAGLETAKRINRDVFTMNIPIPPTPSKNNKVLPTPTPKSLMKRFSIPEMTFKTNATEKAQVNKIIDTIVKIELNKLNPTAKPFVPK